jgi:hypothetical protein
MMAKKKPDVCRLLRATTHARDPAAASKVLEKSGAKVEAVSHHEQRNQQTGSAKHHNLRQNFELWRV